VLIIIFYNSTLSNTNRFFLLDIYLSFLIKFKIIRYYFLDFSVKVEFKRAVKIDFFFLHIYTVYNNYFFLLFSTNLFISIHLFHILFFIESKKKNYVKIKITKCKIHIKFLYYYRERYIINSFFRTSRFFKKTWDG